MAKTSRKYEIKTFVHLKINGVITGANIPATVSISDKDEITITNPKEAEALSKEMLYEAARIATKGNKVGLHVIGGFITTSVVAEDVLAKIKIEVHNDELGDCQVLSTHIEGGYAGRVKDTILKILLAGEQDG
jgi:hypothetical protein